MAKTKTPVYLEVGKKRTFACAVDWPGWCRSAKDEAGAIEALAAYLPRYEPVIRAAGLAVPKGLDSFDVIERISGNATTDFGAPGVVPDLDETSITKPRRARLAAIVQAAWSTFDAVVASAPAELRKGPRGGGRDRDKVADHVLSAENAYARKLGVKVPAPSFADAGAVDAFRAALAGAIAAGSQPEGTKGWPVRYAARRIAWHVLDHAWEIEDRS